MSVQITTVDFDVTAPAPSTRRGKPRPGSCEVNVELHRGGFRIWEAEYQSACSDSYHFGDPHYSFTKSISEMPFFDAIFRCLTAEYAANRGNPLGEFLAPAVQAMEAVVAERDGSSVYFAESVGRVKIGWSKKVATRIAQLQTGCPDPIRLLGTTPGGLGLERRLHEQFASARVGGEWFELTPDLRAHIESVT